MKKVLLSLVLLANCALAQVKNGEVVPNVNFKTILNAPLKNVELDKLKGKVVLIEFWATWCGPCVKAMPHLNKLQQKYGDKLQVITVTSEAPKRIEQFLKVKPSNLWFAIDTGGAVATLFPHQIIPHTVLISPEGALLANTSPESVTESVIDSLLAKQVVHLKEKKDNLVGLEELIDQMFAASDTVKNRFIMQPEIKGAGSASKNYANSPIYNGRRITGINIGFDMLYRIAYGNFPYSRVINKTNHNDKQPLYCVDIIVEHKKDLLPTLQKELSKRSDLKAKVEQHIKEAYVLEIVNKDLFKNIPRNTSGKRTYYSRHGEIDQQSINMAEFADYLESFGVRGNLPVVDNTHNKDKFDLKFSFQPEDPNSLIQVLKGMGLGLKKEQQKIDMLLLYK